MVGAVGLVRSSPIHCIAVNDFCVMQNVCRGIRKSITKGQTGSPLKPYGNRPVNLRVKIEKFSLC